MRWGIRKREVLSICGTNVKMGHRVSSCLWIWKCKNVWRMVSREWKLRKPNSRESREYSWRETSVDSNSLTRDFQEIPDEDLQEENDGSHTTCLSLSVDWMVKNLRMDSRSCRLTKIWVLISMKRSLENRKHERASVLRGSLLSLVCLFKGPSLFSRQQWFLWTL